MPLFQQYSHFDGAEDNHLTFIRFHLAYLAQYNGRS